MIPNYTSTKGAIKANYSSELGRFSGCRTGFWQDGRKKRQLKTQHFSAKTGKI
jgi:hypothetical protein